VGRDCYPLPAGIPDIRLVFGGSGRLLCLAQREDLNGHPMGQSLRNLGLAALAIDIAVPPLLLLVLS
jgi:hypothetical protein